MGQITSPLAGTIRYTTYPSAPLKKDPIFIYCNSSGSQKGSLNAVSPGGTGPFSSHGINGMKSAEFQPVHKDRPLQYFLQFSVLSTREGIR